MLEKSPMARRRELKSIASGIVRHCVSRNNDQTGYWAMGIIVKAAVERWEYTISLDVMSADALPPELEAFRNYFREKFGEGKSRLGHYIRNFVVDFQISLYSFAGPGKRGRYKIICTVAIIDDLGKRWSSSAQTICHPHDPEFECRSLRATPRESGDAPKVAQ